MSKKKLKKAKKAFEKFLDDGWPFPIVKDSIKMNKEISDNVYYVHIRNEFGNSYTVAYRPVVSGRQSEFYEMAVAVCSTKDQFCRSLGRDLAHSRLLNGECIVLPIGSLGRENVANVLRAMFNEDAILGAVLGEVHGN